MQEASASGTLTYRKVPGNLNPADLLTKHLVAPKALPMTELIGQRRMVGGAEKRLQLRKLGARDLESRKEHEDLLHVGRIGRGRQSMYWVGAPRNQPCALTEGHGLRRGVCSMHALRRFVETDKRGTT